MRTTLIAALCAGALYGDAGAVFFREASGDFVFTLFSDPAPFRVGSAELNVMLQEEGGAPVLDADVQAFVDDQPTRAVAGAGGNPLFYSAPVRFERPGSHAIRIEVKRNGKLVAVTDRVNVLEAASPLRAYWPYFAIPPAAVVLFVLNQMLKARRKRVSSN